MMEFVFLSNKGKRENNEDAYANYKSEFFLVADGLGGRPAGEVAAKIAAETATSIYQFSKKEKPKRLLRNVFDRANNEILLRSKENKKWYGMGTTAVCVLISRNKLYFANVGDSRGYLFSDGKLTLKTQDDRDDWSSLLEALGADEEVKPHISIVKSGKNDVVLLCSDGLSDFVSDEIIEKILRSKVSLKNKAEGLVDAALQFGSTDNITAGLIKL